MSEGNATVLTIINPTESKRYKVTLRGDISAVTVKKLKRFLESSCGIIEADQILKYNGIELGDDVVMGDVGISHGSTLTILRRGAAPYTASPIRMNVELETIDQQRAQLHAEQTRRDADLRRRQDMVSKSLMDAERRRVDLERERQEQELELQRLREAEKRAEAERQRISTLRQAEAEREQQRLRDLEQRKSQLHAQRLQERHIEMQKLENERKKMLLAQQKSEFESEKARLERERQEFYDRRRKREMELREKEIELDRQRIESERMARELEIDRAVSDEHRMVDVETSVRRSVPAFASTPRLERSEVQGLPPRSRASELFRDPVNTPSAAPPMPPPAPPPSISRQPLSSESVPPRNLLAVATQHVELAAVQLGVEPPVFDDNNSCVLTADERNAILITFDPATERLYLYSTVATFIPKDPSLRLRLYEMLLEGALLGRDMCGGGVGASLRNDFILMSTSVTLAHTSTHATAAVVVPFVDTLTRWRGRVADFLVAEGHDSVATPSGVATSPVPERPVLGLEVSDGVVIDGMHRRYSDGVLVVGCRGPAHRAGLLPNDFIRAVNGKAVTGLVDFRETVRTLKPHTSVPLSIDRAGVQLVISILVGSAVLGGDEHEGSLARSAY